MPILTNPRHERFAQEYARTGNGKQSYISAGYSENGAEASASQLLRNPKVASRIAEIQRIVSERAIRASIREKNARIAAYQDRWERMQRVIDARAAEMKDVPGGGETGLLVRQMKQIGSGKDAQIIEQYEVDAGLLRELRAHEEQAAKELGDWVDKAEVKNDVQDVLSQARQRLAVVKPKPADSSAA